jgi:hypothetical protein
MSKRILIALTFLSAAAITAASAQAGPRVDNWRARRMMASYPWHGYYYHVAWGQPVALVVPPRASLQTHWSWGVAQTSVTPIWHQFSRSYPGPYEGGIGFLGTPRWPSHTDQFGVYYVRGPW